MDTKVSGQFNGPVVTVKQSFIDTLSQYCQPTPLKFPESEDLNYIAAEA
jgi:hypothetical protein